MSVAFLLLIPLFAMLFTNEVKWTLADFIAAAALLGGGGLVCELIMRKVKNRNYKIAISAIVIIIMLLTCMELAVGIFGTSFAGD